MRAAGSVCEAVDKVVAGECRNSFCAVRPPGHHAGPRGIVKCANDPEGGSHGFCLLNNVAIGAAYARCMYRNEGIKKIAIVDFDVHHGNGTQDIFWSDKDLFFGSTHQMPLYPGSGAVTETGVGNICNAPLRPNDDGVPFREAFESRILRELDVFQPDLLMISAGFDAHEADPLANLRLVEADFAWATEQLLEVAARHCGGRVVSMLEGGYDLKGLAGSAAVHVKTLMDA